MTTKYLTYREDTGEIKTWGTADMPPPVIPEEHGVLMWGAVGAPSTHYVNNQVLTAYTNAQAVAKANPPTYPAIWSNTSFSWVDQRSLDDAKLQTWISVRVGRDAEVYGSFAWDGSRFDSDQVSQTRIQGAVQLATIAIQQGQNINIGWTLYDNTTRTLSALEFVQLGVALGNFVTSIFAAGVALRNQIDAATTIQQVDAIKWVNIF